jgi:hypothetical protein
MAPPTEAADKAIRNERRAIGVTEDSLARAGLFAGKKAAMRTAAPPGITFPCCLRSQCRTISLYGRW